MSTKVCYHHSNRRVHIKYVQGSLHLHTKVCLWPCFFLIIQFSLKSEPREEQQCQKLWQKMERVPSGIWLKKNMHLVICTKKSVSHCCYAVPFELNDLVKLYFHEYGHSLVFFTFHLLSSTHFTTNEHFVCSTNTFTK